MKAVLDTNVIVSRFISTRGTPARIFRYWEQRAFDLLVTDDILDEYRDVLSRPTIRRSINLDVNQIAELIDYLSRFSIAVEAERFDVRISVDADDDMFLACALAGSADYIVTGDRHLLVLDDFHGIPIVQPAFFAALLDHHVEP